MVFLWAELYFVTSYKTFLLGNSFSKNIEQSPNVYKLEIQ